jgi:hypothetical protein
MLDKLLLLQGVSLQRTAALVYILFHSQVTIYRLTLGSAPVDIINFWHIRLKSGVQFIIQICHMRRDIFGQKNHWVRRLPGGRRLARRINGFP